MNFPVILGAALIPLVIGAIWYNPKVLGTAWMNSTGLTEEQLRGGNMPLIFGLTYLFGIFMAMALTSWCIHQNSIDSLLAMQEGYGEAGSEIQNYIDAFKAKYGNLHRDFKHGAIHGAFGSVFLALPVIASSALFERKSAKYILIHWGYWLVTLALMGGVICQFH